MEQARAFGMVLGTVFGLERHSLEWGSLICVSGAVGWFEVVIGY